MLRWALSGPVYVPFIGDGDIAADLYSDRPIYGADIDGQRVKRAQARLKGDIREADCDQWPFHDVTVKFAIADFDAYSHPYPAFEAFWANANKLDRMVLFFTDGHRQAILRLGVHVLPNGVTEYPANVYEKQPRNYFYLTDYAWPYVDKTIGPDWRVLERMRYARQTITYWACAIERVKGRVRQSKPQMPPSLYHGAPHMVPQGASQRVAVPASVRKKRAQREREQKKNG
jgi:hypothetical protein